MAAVAGLAALFYARYLVGNLNHLPEFLVVYVFTGFALFFFFIRIFFLHNVSDFTFKLFNPKVGFFRNYCGYLLGFGNPQC